MYIKFGSWLRYELWRRGWSRGLFYELSGINGARIRVLIDGTAKKSVTVRECEAFAKALGIDFNVIREAALGNIEAPAFPDDRVTSNGNAEAKNQSDGCIPVLP